MDAGYHIATKGGKGMFSTEIGIGKRFNKNFYWGLGTGAFISTDGGDPSIPLTSDFKVYFPSKIHISNAGWNFPYRLCIQYLEEYNNRYGKKGNYHRSTRQYYGTNNARHGNPLIKTGGF